MTLRKCIDCGAIDTSNPYRILCPRGQGFRTREERCILNIPTVERIREIRRQIETKQLTKETYALCKTILEEWLKIEEKLDGKHRRP